MKHIQKSERSTAAVSREPNRTRDPSSIPQSLWSQKMNSQQAAASQANNALKTGKQVPFAMLYPVIEPLLDKDKAMRLRIIYNGLKERRISRDVFVKHVRGLVGDHVLKLAATKLQEQASRSSQTAPNQVASNVQFPAQQHHLNSSAQSLKQQPQNIQVKLQAEMEELKKEKAGLENHLKVALNNLKNWIARAVKAESSNSELASKLQTYEAIYKAKVEELQSVHDAELKKLQTELEEVRPNIVNSMDVTIKLFEDYYAKLDSSLFINAP